MAGGHYDEGGAAGGLTGYTGGAHSVVSYRGHGGSQISGGFGSKENGGFGYGGTNGKHTDGHAGGSGGGGYYGGGGSIWHSGGGGGSSYISGHDGCIAIDELGTPTKDSIHYSNIYFSDTLMIDGNGYEWTDKKEGYTKMPDPYGNYIVGKTGNGYARITLLEDPSQNNLIKEIQINKGTITPEVSFDSTEYTVEVGPEDTEFTIYGVVDDITAQIEGNGTYSILPGENIIELTVTAENGDVRLYTITVKRESSSNSKPVNIMIDGLIEALININPEKYGILEPENFDPNVHEYSMIVPSRLKKLTFNVEKGHEYQTITGDGQIILDKEHNQIEINVTSEDGTKTDTYIYNIERDMTGNCMLESLKVIGYEDDIAFDQDVLEYYLLIPNEVKSLEIEAIPEVKTLNPIIIGNTDLQIGLNDIYIIVNAENGEQLVYIIHTYRAMSGNTFLSNLEVNSGDEKLEMTPEFNKILDTYTIYVPNEIDNVNIIAIPEVATTNVNGAGNKTLTTGINIFTLTTTAQDGSKDTYTVNIERERDNNNYLKNLSSLEGEFEEVFNKEQLEYHIEVDSSVNHLNLTIEKEVDTSKVQIMDNRNFKAGENIVNIKVIAENGDERIYQIIVNRKQSENNYLSMLSTDYGILNPEFNKEITEYTVEVENEVGRISVNAIREDLLSTVLGTGEYALQVGENNICVTVVSESGEIRNYNLNIIRKLNSNTNLLEIENSEDKEAIKVNDNTYRIEVANDVKKIDINGIPEVETTIVSGNGKQELVVGENLRILTAQAEDGTTKEYTIIINRLTSNNANLKRLFIEESDYSPYLTNDITEYYTKILAGTSNLTLEVETEDEGATYEIIGNENFVNGENLVIIRVTASDGITQKDYKINAFMQEENTGSNYLYVLTVNKGTLNPNFNKEIQVYEVVVPYAVSNIEIDAITEDSMATLSGTGKFDLEVGLNVFAVKVTSTDNIERTYQIKITREKSDETRLKMLDVKEHTINPIFDMDTKTYYVETNLLELDIYVETYDNEATYEIIGNENLQKGTNNIIIRVTAANEVDTTDYNLVVTRTESYNNNLEYLKVEGYSLIPEFNKATSVYTVNVESEVNKVNIEAKPEFATSTVTGTGIITLNSGKNVVPITVTSESGRAKTYTVIINKPKSNNNYLEALLVSDGDLLPTFNKEVNEYNLEVEYEIENLLVLSYPENSMAKITGAGQIELDEGNNKIDIIVTSESGLKRTYTINVLRKPAISALLKNIKIKNYELTPEFETETKKYSITVDNEVTSLDLDIETLDKNATYTITGNENFVVGMNEVKIDVLSSDGITTATYYISVNRQIYSNNFLSYILPSQGKLEPSFDKKTVNYEIFVDDTVESIYIDAETEDSNSIVEGIGTYSLNKGKNIVKLEVTSSLGIKRIYTVTIVRTPNGNNNLSKLEVKNGSTIIPITPVFSKDVLEYSVDVEEGTSRLQIIAEAEHHLSTISGDGYITVNSGENKYNIIVTAEDESTKNYILTVNRKSSSNNYLTDLIPSAGTLSPSFSYEETEYNLVLGNTDAMLSFEVNTENRYATVTGIDSEIVPDGSSVREIVVIAEDGSKRIYTVNVTKNRTDDARLKFLEVMGYEFEEIFNENKYVYTINVPNEITKFLASDVIAEAKYDTSTIYLDSDLELTTRKTNVFNVKVLAEDGFTTQTYKINIIRAKSDNNNLSDLKLKVGDKVFALTPEFDKDILEYTAELGNDDYCISFEAIPECSFATVTGDEETYIEDGENTREIIVTAENGDIKKYTVNINKKKSNDPRLRSLAIKSYQLDQEFDPDLYEYTLTVPNDKFEMTENEIVAKPKYENASISYTGHIELSVLEINKYQVFVTSPDGTQTATYTINVTRKKSSNSSLSNLSVTGYKIKEEFRSDLLEYTVLVPKGTTIFEVDRVIPTPTDQYATIERSQENLDLSIGEKNYEIKLTSHDETTQTTYKLNVEFERSDNAYLKTLTVTGGELLPEFTRENTIYDIKMESMQDELIIEAEVEDGFANIVEGTGTFKITENKKQILLKVQAEDESYRIYILNVIKDEKDKFSVSGKILTQNSLGKNLVNIEIYDKEQNLITELVTNEDGSYEINLECGIYDFIIKKLGYLDYKILNINLFENIVLDEYHLIAGDVVKTDEIEIDDLVAITDKFGTSILSEEDENRIFDLNEDGIVNQLDIDILKGNYGKKAESVEWKNPNEIENLELTDSVNVIYTGYKQNQTQIIKQDFILPISCDYRITSEYGTRIHPVTGEEKKHTGIDISGTHHTEIYSIADGEVTFAGVQNGFGNCIEIKHVVDGETIYSFYAHLSRIDVEAGQTVTQGQVIGLEGGDPTLDPNPGSSTGHHLHFEIRTSTGYGNDTNPTDYIKF